MQITRRTLLATLGATAGTAAVAGCTGTSPSGSDDTTTGPSETSTGTGQPPHTTTQRFRDVPCPSFGSGDHTVCWHSKGDADVYLQPSTEWFKPVSGNDDVETIRFTLRNDRDGPFTLNPHAWAVKRQTDSGWVHVAPDATIQPLVELPPGASYEWVLSRGTHPTPNAERTLYPEVDLQNGRHAFVVSGWLGGLEEAGTTAKATTTGSGSSTARTSTARSPPKVECVALFDVTRIYADTGTRT